MASPDYHKIGKRLRDDADKFFRKGHKLFNKTKINFSKIKIKDFVHDKHCNRIFLGIGAEYFVKATFLLNGFHIFESKLKNSPLPANYKEKHSDIINLSNEKTLNFSKLISYLPKALSKYNKEEIKKIKEGLEILRKWRNHSIHLGGGFTERGTDYPKIIRALKLLAKYNHSPKFIKASVEIYLDYKASNGMIRIHEVKLIDTDGDEFQFNSFDEGAYFGYKDEPEIKEIKKYLQERLKKEGFIFPDNFDYFIETEDIIVL